jgi:iron complex transport system substrate-binding protein
MLQRATVLVLLLAAVLALAACGGDGGGGPGAGAKADFPITIENCGRQVTIDKPPQRALALGAEAPQLLAAAGTADKIKIIPVDTSGSLLYGDGEPFVRKAEKIGQSGELSIEEVIGARPDIFIGALPPTSSVTIGSLDAAGIPALVPSGYCVEEDPGPKPEPGSPLELVYHDVETYGRVFGTEQTARKSVAELRARVAAVQNRVAGAPRGSTAALYLYADQPFGAYGNKSVVDEQMRILGLTNVFGDVDKRYFDPSVEEIVDSNPQQIIALFLPGQSMLPTPASAVEEVQSRPELANVDAVRNGAILPLNYYYTGPGTLAVEGLEQLADQLLKQK